ncbi:hypothetical protein [Rhizobium leguminosarum]|uniref:hypothetical protein n=1 Tax=Rhizobium leguminosarum TaxID=384 RepID=UPI001441BD69|nr:hypothetical protein [Rhizobium leguminosarum]
MSIENSEQQSKLVHVAVDAKATPSELWKAMCKAARLDPEERKALKWFLASQEERR